MSADENQRKSIDEAIREILDTGSIAALVTLVDSAELRVGAKLLVKENGEVIGSLGSAALDDAVIRQAARFFGVREVAKLSRVAEFSRELMKFQDAVILF